MKRSKFSFFLFQPFKYIKDNRTGKGIVIGKIEDLYHFLSVGMRIFPAGVITSYSIHYTKLYDFTCPVVFDILEGLKKEEGKF